MATVAADPAGEDPTSNDASHSLGNDGAQGEAHLTVQRVPGSFLWCGAPLLKDLLR